MGVRAARDRGVPARVLGRQPRAGGATRRSRSGCSTCSSARASRDWPWFEDRLTYCNARLPQALLVTSEWSDERGDAGRGRALARMAGRRCRPPTTTTSRRSARTASTCAAARARASISSRSRRARWCRRASTRGGSPATGAGSARARRAFDWFLGQNELQRSLYDPATGGVPRRPARRSRSTRTRAPSRRCRFSSRCSRCARTDRVGADAASARGAVAVMSEPRLRDAAPPPSRRTRSCARAIGRIRRTPCSTPARRACATARRCCCAASRIAAVTRICARRARPTASTAG